MKKLILIFFMILISFGCRENKKTEEKNLEKSTKMPETQEDNLLKIIINATVLVDDVFEVYFYELGEKTFHSKDYVSSKIKGMNESQDIIFIMPEKTYPERLRLDFGKRKTQKPIQLNYVKIVYNTKEYLFSPEEIKALKPSKFIDYDVENLIVKTKEINNRYDPYFYTNKVNSIINYLLED